MSDKKEPIRINIGYAFGQLQKALTAAGGDASARVQKWQRVITCLLDGSLRLGSRTPLADVPPWVTLEVVHGGFATGQLAAGGPLRLHEVEKLGQIPKAGGLRDRAALNLYYVGDEGRSELTSMLESGRFRIGVPEEAALLVADWLIGQLEGQRATQLMDTITPYFNRLRFYPIPHQHPIRTGTAVYVRTAGDSVRSLRLVRAQKAVQVMRESITVWNPLYDRALSLFQETVEGDVPRMRAAVDGALLRAANGQPIVEGGWPCRRFPDGWSHRAQGLLDEYFEARKTHRLSGKPDKPKENFARLRTYLAKCVAGPQELTGRDIGMIRKILASCATRRGLADATEHQKLRARQIADASRPLHRDVAEVVARRLDLLPQDEGVPQLDDIVSPLTSAEAEEIAAAPGQPLPPSVAAKASRCLEAPIPDLVAAGLVPSSEVIANVLPLLTAHVRSQAIADPALRRVFQGVYLAFRRRRSLLLLDLESQVKIGELPWVAAIEPWAGSDQATQDAARETLKQAATIELEEFPQTIIPNRLVKEFRALAATAELRLPLVDELATDIFMGSFSEVFLRSAQAAGGLLKGSLYEHYYGLNYGRVLALDDLVKSQFGKATSPGFAKLCEDLANIREEPRQRWSVARNGTIVEQEQILTTHNLAVLWNGLGLESSMSKQLPSLALRTFKWVCARQQIVIRNWQAQMQMVKNAAYGWRQMVFFLSLMSSSGIASFQSESASYFAEQGEDFQRRFQPAVDGLNLVLTGGHFERDGSHASGARRFLGWSIGRHWALGERTEPETATR